MVGEGKEFSINERETPGVDRILRLYRTCRITLHKQTF